MRASEQERRRLRRTARAVVAMTRHYRDRYSPLSRDRDLASDRYVRGVENGACMGLAIGMDANGRYSVADVCRRYIRRYGDRLA